MTNANFLLAVILGPLIGLCATAKTGSGRYAFDFTFAGDAYQIVSMVKPEDGGRNYLIRRDGETLVLRARDADQDGRLDTVLTGGVTLSQANEIYEWGIAEAQAIGKYREQMPRPDLRGVEASSDGGPSPLSVRQALRPSFTLLVFTKTAGYVHASIPDGVAALHELGRLHGFGLEVSDDATVFESAGLDSFAAVVFLNTTLDVFDEAQQVAFQEYIQGGGGFVGVHSAADTEYDWPWYGELVGAYLESHPEIQQATIAVTDTLHPSTAGLPLRWQRTDEWYDFKSNPRDRVHVLATIDETTYSGGKLGGDHPMAWCHEYDGGRAWYTAFGHTPESYSEPLFIEHLLGGIRYAAGVLEGDCALTDVRAAP